MKMVKKNMNNKQFCLNTFSKSSVTATYDLCASLTCPTCVCTLLQSSMTDGKRSVWLEGVERQKDKLHFGIIIPATL